MVNETSGENLLDFSKRMLDEAFGTNKNNTEETLLPKVEDPDKGKGVQTPAVSPSSTTSEPKEEPRLEQKINVSSLQEQPVKGVSSDLVTSIETKNSSISEGIEDISIISKEDTTEALRSPGFMEMRLKRKSNLVPEENDPVDTQPVTDELHIETDNPSHLFWVPAHLHPEIAPNEFRKWLKNHAKDGFNSGVGSLRRRKSTLSKQYIPSEVEEDDEETDKKMESEKKSPGFDWESYGLSDGNISPTAESTKLNILRRSLSLNLPPFMGGSINPNDPNIFDRHSSPDVDSKVLVPRMAPALKRAARTKIRRNSVAGEENSRRFSAHRRTRSTHVSSDKGKQSEDNNVVSKMLKQKSDSALSAPQIVIERVDMNLTDKDSSEIVDEPEEISKDIELDCIDVKDGTGPIRITLKDNGPVAVGPEVIPSPQTGSLPSKADELSSELPSELQADQVPLLDKSNLLKVDTSEPAQSGTFSTTSPSTSPTSTSPTSPTSPTAAAPTQPKRTSAWSWLWSGGSEEKLKDKEKDGEKEKEEKEHKSKKSKSDKSEKSDKNDENNDPIVIKEKDKEKSTKKSFSSIFSWQNKAKSTDDSSANTNTTTSLLQPTISNKKTKYTNYNRLPIHVERAIYRLSHVKLANPRRPLHEQVLISNMMFWYLSLINKQQVECGGSGNPNAEIAAHKVKSKVGKEKTSRKRKKTEKKSGLTRKGAGPGSSAEIAYKAPQYDMNQISQQYTTPSISNSTVSYSNEFEEETVEDYGDNNDYHNEEEIQSHSYHHYNDDYLSDGTDGGYLDETNGRIESSHSGGLLHSSAEFDNIGESSSGVKITKNYARSPSPNGRPSSPNGRSKSPTSKRPSSPDGRSTTVSSNAQRNSVPPSNKHKLMNIPRNRSSSAGTRPSNSHKISSKISTVNSIPDDEDDDVPLGLYKLSSNTK